MFNQCFFTYTLFIIHCKQLEEERKQIESQIRSNGGNYHPDLSRHCTHLLCASTAGKKYEAALKWNIQCVGIEWLYQSIERGMALDSKYFGLDIEPAKRGLEAWDRDTSLKLSVPSGLMDFSYDTIAPIDAQNGGRKRRRRAGSQIAQQGIWDGILGGVKNTQTNAIQNLGLTNIEESIYQQGISIVEEPVGHETTMDFNDPVRGLFEGLIFYTWGFTDKKVDGVRRWLTIRERFLQM
jgi:hypothetical protein